MLLQGTNMQCKHAQELLSDYISGSVAPALSVSLENHMAECAGCRQDLSGLREVWKQLEDIPMVDTPMYFHENIMSSIDKQIVADESIADIRSRSFDWRSLFRPRSLAYAAAVLVLLMGGAGVMKTTQAGLGFHIAWFNPTPALNIELEKSSQAQIMFDTIGGARMIVHMQAAKLPNSRSMVLHYTLNIKGSSTILQQGTVTSDKEIVLPVQLAEVPDKTFTLEAKLSYTDPDGNITKLKQVIPVNSVPFSSDPTRTNAVTP